MTPARTAALALLAALGAAVAWTWMASALFLWWTGLEGQFSQATMQWWLYAWVYGLSHPVVGAPLWQSGAIAALPLLIVAGRLGHYLWLRPRPLHGESRFATRREARQSGVTFSHTPREDSIILGCTGWGPWRKYVCLPDSGHVALYAMTGAGKGVSFVVPNCLTWGSSMVVFDVKGELWRKTAAARRAMGQEVFCFAPSASDGRSCRYNPYSVVPRGGARCIDMIHRINHLLIPPTPKNSDGPARYFDESARNAINGACVILAETPGEPLHPGAVRRCFVRPDWREYWRGMIQRARIAGRPYSQTATEAVLGIVDDPDERGREGVRKTIESYLGLWASPSVVAATEASDFDLTQIRKRPMSIYLWLRPSEMRRFRPLTAVLFQQLIDLNTEVEFDQDPAHTQRVLLMMDEFWAMGRMDVLADAAAFVRSYGLRLAYVVQTRQQLVSLYGPEGADNLFENTSAEIVFGVKGVKLAREVSEMAGFDTVQERSQSRPRFWAGLQWSKQTESESARRRALLLPQEIQRLSPKRQIIFRPALPPMQTGRVVYWKDRLLKRLESAPPPVPALHIHVAKDDGKAPQPLTGATP